MFRREHSVGEAAERRRIDAELAHARAQRVRVDVEQARRALRPFDAAQGAAQRAADMVRRRLFQRGVSSALSGLESVREFRVSPAGD